MKAKPDSEILLDLLDELCCRDCGYEHARPAPQTPTPTNLIHSGTATDVWQEGIPALRRAGLEKRSHGAETPASKGQETAGCQAQPDGRTEGHEAQCSEPTPEKDRAFIVFDVPSWFLARVLASEPQ